MSLIKLLLFLLNGLMGLKVREPKKEIVVARTIRIGKRLRKKNLIENESDPLFLNSYVAVPFVCPIDNFN